MLSISLSYCAAGNAFSSLRQLCSVFPSACLCWPALVISCSVVGLSQTPKMNQEDFLPSLSNNEGETLKTRMFAWVPEILNCGGGSQVIQKMLSQCVSCFCLPFGRWLSHWEQGLFCAEDWGSPQSELHTDCPGCPGWADCSTWLSLP